MITLKNVTKTYKRGELGEVVALDDVSLEVAKGEFVFVVGPSGSGKSTLMKLLTREQRPDSGEVFVAGKNLGTLRSWKVPHLRRAIGYVYQDFKLLPNRTVYENVSFALQVIGQPTSRIERRVPEVLDLVGLSEKSESLPHELSGGQQQRVSIARAFVNNPRLMLCDEPTGNLDPTTSVGIMKLLDRINRTGTTIVMATHDHAIVDAMQRRVVAVDGGAVVRDDAAGRYETTMQNAVTAQAGTVSAPPGQPVGAAPVDDQPDAAEPDAAELEVADEPIDSDTPSDAASSGETFDEVEDVEVEADPADDRVGKPE